MAHNQQRLRLSQTDFRSLALQESDSMESKRTAQDLNDMETMRVISQSEMLGRLRAVEDTLRYDFQTVLDKRDKKGCCQRTIILLLLQILLFLCVGVLCGYVFVDSVFEALNEPIKYRSDPLPTPGTVFYPRIVGCAYLNGMETSVAVQTPPGVEAGVVGVVRPYNPDFTSATNTFTLGQPGDQYLCFVYNADGASSGDRDDELFLTSARLTWTTGDKSIPLPGFLLFFDDLGTSDTVEDYVNSHLYEEGWKKRDERKREGIREKEMIWDVENPKRGPVSDQQGTNVMRVMKITTVE